MSEGNTFGDLIRRVRAGDAQATSEVVGRYEPAIRLAVRARLTDPAMRRLLDSMDICQSVLASFFLRAANGEYELERPGQLIRLLETMARNKLIKQVERQKTQRRGGGHHAKANPDSGDFVAHAPSPSDEVSFQELLDQFRSRLSPTERRIAELRSLGWTWDQIAEEIGGHPDSVRIEYTRTVNRVMHEMGLEV